MRLLSRPLGVVRIRWVICRRGWWDAAAVVEVFDPGGDPGVDLVAGGEGAPVVVVGCEGGPQDWAMALSQHTPARPIDTLPSTARM